MPKKVVRSSFNSGELDPKLHARGDLPQWPTGLRTGTNGLLLAHGGWRRRPGLKLVRELDEPGRMARFRFNREVQYLLDFVDLFVEVSRKSGEPITRIATPYVTAKLRALDVRAQTADTLVIYHQAHAPHRLLRAALRAVNPLRTTAASAIVRVYQQDHGLLNLDQVGLADLEAIDGISAQYLNTNHQVLLVTGTAEDAGSSDEDTLEVVSEDPTVIRIKDLGGDFGFEVGDRIALKNFAAIPGIPAAQINRTQTLVAVSGVSADFQVESQADTGEEGGGAGTWTAASFYEIDLGAHVASAGADGGGAAGRAWVLHSLAPNTDRPVAFTDLPQFDFQDALSPPPKREIQQLTFNDFLAGDQYVLIVPVPALAGRKLAGTGVQAGATLRTPSLVWTDTLTDNASIIENAINDAAPESQVVTVTYTGSDGGLHKYKFEFADAVDYEDIQPGKLRSVAGTIVQETLVEGGSTEEDVISDTRGWPGAGLFFQRRSWLYRLLSRPSTILGSYIERFYNFLVGTGQDSEAIDGTGEFDPILHLIAEDELILLTADSRGIVRGGGDGAAITPGNILIRSRRRNGATAVVPVSVGGRVTYVGAIGKDEDEDDANVGADRARGIWQLAIPEGSATGQVEPVEISVLSGHLIGEPTVLEVWSNRDGDYLFCLNDDGTFAVLSINVDQGVFGWTPITTQGQFVDACEVGGTLFVTVKRTIDGEDRYFREAFDYDYFSDCAVQAELADETEMTGLDHLEGETVQVRADEKTMTGQVVTDGSVQILNADVPIPSVHVEVGLAIPVPTCEPMPAQIDEYSAISKASVDLFESRAIYVNGYRLRDLKPGQSLGAGGSLPLITGLRAIQLRGYGDRMSVRITCPEPQPCHVRAIEMEVV